MPDGSGIVENHAFFGPFMTTPYNHSKNIFPGLGAIKIGTAVKKYAGW